jgi:hypothetical protein
VKSSSDGCRVRVPRTYQRDWLRPDPVAGIVLAAILVPQGMAHASGRRRASATASVHDDVIVRFSRLVPACPMEALSTRNRKISTGS